MERHIRLAIPFVALAALSACQSTRTDYPSLAIRDAERVEGTFAVGAGANPLPAPAPRYGQAPEPLRDNAPAGGDSADILAQLGYSSAEAQAILGDDC